MTPITTSTLGFIGDATPAGWSTTEATTFTKTSDSPLQFTYEGALKTGEFSSSLMLPSSRTTLVPTSRLPRQV